jgi:hypothetical protein
VFIPLDEGLEHVEAVGDEGSTVSDAMRRISSNINEFFAEVATDAETALLDTLARRTVADSLTELLRLDGIRTKRLTLAATTRRAKLPANGVKRT